MAFDCYRHPSKLSDECCGPVLSRHSAGQVHPRCPPEVVRRLPCGGGPGLRQEKCRLQAAIHGTPFTATTVAAATTTQIVVPNGEGLGGQSEPPGPRHLAIRGSRLRGSEGETWTRPRRRQTNPKPDTQGLGVSPRHGGGGESAGDVGGPPYPVPAPVPGPVSP